MNLDDIIRMARSVRDGEHWDQLDLVIFGLLVAAHEREACALVCENIEDHDETISDTYYSDHYAKAIRARGQA